MFDDAVEEEWRDIEIEETDQIEEYDLTSSPNDFNVSTIFSFIESGAVKIPGFQRNYVWDIKRASKLIESLIIGLPVPQVFLYEEDRNRFLVVDGQQRLMTIYYFVKERFPRKERRSEIRKIFGDAGTIPDDILHDDDYFESFDLRLAEVRPGGPNRFNKLRYSTLGEYRMQFDLRTIRNIIVKQVRPSDDTSSIYEMFNRLNTGGVNLTPQEIRSSLYHSSFYDDLFKWNLDDRWRALLGRREPDLHMRDIEVLLRAFAVWRLGDEYTPSMVRFLNRFSHNAQRYGESERSAAFSNLDWFLSEAKNVERNAWLRQKKFSVPLFESIFAAACRLRDEGFPVVFSTRLVMQIRDDSEFQAYASERTTHTENVKGRLRVARTILESAGK
ncbi:Protein of unknown function DUF262 [Micromonospora chersina]|uniref:GmrSD restriction endonucleases N-terminal domain-containing protein n=1 Tax=Micromonospora chersina TaxID=47854 RepID=A0A1C6V155_9ACTN|nr:Protein of unknown function DUF262 [Micromonospora chersina]